MLARLCAGVYHVANCSCILFAGKHASILMYEDTDLKCINFLLCRLCILGWYCSRPALAACVHQLWFSE